MERSTKQLHAEGVAGVLRLLGPRPRARLVRMLQGLGLSHAEADVVLAVGVEEGLFEHAAGEPDAFQARAQADRR